MGIIDPHLRIRPCSATGGASSATDDPGRSVVLGRVECEDSPHPRGRIIRRIGGKNRPAVRRISIASRRQLVQDAVRTRGGGTIPQKGMGGPQASQRVGRIFVTRGFTQGNRSKAAVPSIECVRNHSDRTKWRRTRSVFRVAIPRNSRKVSGPLLPVRGLRPRCYVRGASPKNNSSYCEAARRNS